MEITSIDVLPPEGSNIIVGMAHFIKTVEDLYEVIISSVPGIKFGVAFCEASGPCLVRHTGNQKDLETFAIETSQKIGAGHSFFIIMKEGYPINVLNAIKMVSEVCSIYCATANPINVIIAETEQGRAIIGVVDGYKPKGIENSQDLKDRITLLRELGYKTK